MGAKKVLPVYSLITNGVMTGTSTISSTPTHVGNLDNIGLQVSWTGSATGTFSVATSNFGIIWDDLTFSAPLTKPAGTDGHYSISINQIPWPLIRVSYTNASGTGVLNVTISAKDLN